MIPGITGGVTPGPGNGDARTSEPTTAAAASMAAP
jgi:hypothetical protein